MLEAVLGGQSRWQEFEMSTGALKDDHRHAMGLVNDTEPQLDFGL